MTHTKHIKFAKMVYTKLYEKNVAENRMIKMFPTARPDETVAGVEQLLLGRAKSLKP